MYEYETVPILSPRVARYKRLHASHHLSGLWLQLLKLLPSNTTPS